MVRIRVPGGQTTGPALARLGAIAAEHGSGLLQLTSRASLQVRGLPTSLPDAFERAVAEAGFLPSATHERVRNIVASPLTGLMGGRADLRAMVMELDQALQADLALVGLSGRFLFGLDDGRGDVAALEPDFTYRAADLDGGHVLVGGTGRGYAVPTGDVVPTLVELALRFEVARQQSGVWRVAELPGWADQLPGLVDIPATPEPGPQPLGAVGQHAVVAVPLGFLTPARLAAVSSAASGAVVVTPWRSLVLADAAAELGELTATGLVADPASVYTVISACVGAPWCAKGRVDTQALVHAVAGVDATWGRTHVSGCERRCGAPTTEHHDLVAPTYDELRAVAQPQLAHA